MIDNSAWLFKTRRRIIELRREANRLFGTKHEAGWNAEYRDRLARLKERARYIQGFMNEKAEAA